MRPEELAIGGAILSVAALVMLWAPAPVGWFTAGAVFGFLPLWARARIRTRARAAEYLSALSGQAEAFRRRLEEAGGGPSRGYPRTNKEVEL